VEAGEHREEGAHAGLVLVGWGRDVTGVTSELDAVQRLDRAELLGHLAEGDDGLAER